MNRRKFVAVGASLAALGAAGCSTTEASRSARAIAAAAPPKIAPPPPTAPSAEILAMYAARPEERFPLPAIDIASVPQRFWRQRVAFSTHHAPGTLLVDSEQFYLHLVEEGGAAMRYGVSLGRAGFEWAGSGVIEWKRAWPTWTPPDSMIAREPHLEKWSVRKGGMPPGLTNPLGARALYVFENGVDTLYRVHGTPDTKSIGYAVSSGCVRMFNQDVVDLYERVRPGARLVTV